MKFYEIRVKATHELKTTIAPNFRTACENIGHKPRECKLIWAASEENACDPKNYF